MIKYINFKIIVIYLLISSCAFGNIGGVFYKKSVAGISIDSSKSITYAETEINCKDSMCHFTTIYHVNSGNCTFSGKFYGARFREIKINGQAINDTLIKPDTLTSDSLIFGRNLVLQNILGGERIASIPITVEISTDSFFTVQGVLHGTKSSNWGLAGYQEMVSLRHPWLNKPNIFNNEYNVTYLFAPIQSFSGLCKVSVKINGENTAVTKRVWHKPVNEADISKLDSNERIYVKKYGADKDSSLRFTALKDSVSWDRDFPDAIEYFYKINSEKIKNHRIISPGGPILFIGGRSKQFHTEIGWEASINPAMFVSILPSATAAFNSKGYMDWSVGLRGYFMGWSIGVNTREFKSAEITFGLDIFGIVGIEGRNNALLAKLSM